MHTEYGSNLDAQNAEHAASTQRERRTCFFACNCNNTPLLPHCMHCVQSMKDLKDRDRISIVCLPA